MKTNAQPIEILLVEDNPDDVELTLRALREHNLANRVKVVADGVEALAYLRPEDAEHSPADGDPKLVLLDLKLPGWAGSRCCGGSRHRSGPARSRSWC